MDDKDTAAVQKAIDDCTAGKGGGTVEVPEGTFVIAPISLKSNMTLHLAKGATLLGSPDIRTIRRRPSPASDGDAAAGSVNAENITINGEGMIDGNGQCGGSMFSGVKDAGVLGTDHPRPMGVVFDHSKHIRWKV